MRKDKKCLALRDAKTGETIATNVSWNDLLAAVAENNRKYFEQIEKQEMDNKNCEGERIRKSLVQTLQLAKRNDGKLVISNTLADKYLAWLEKQAKSERVIKAARRVLNIWLDGTDCPDVPGDFTELEYAIREYDGDEKLKEQKPVPFSCGHENDKRFRYDNNRSKRGTDSL